MLTTQHVSSVRQRNTVFQQQHHGSINHPPRAHSSAPPLVLHVVRMRCGPRCLLCPLPPPFAMPSQTAPPFQGRHAPSHGQPIGTLSVARTHGGVPCVPPAALLYWLCSFPLVLCCLEKTSKEAHNGPSVHIGRKQGRGGRSEGTFAGVICRGCRLRHTAAEDCSACSVARRYANTSETRQRLLASLPWPRECSTRISCSGSASLSNTPRLRPSLTPGIQHL